jgi:hypothetical protein
MSNIDDINIKINDNNFLNLNINEKLNILRKEIIGVDIDNNIKIPWNKILYDNLKKSIDSDCYYLILKLIFTIIIFIIFYFVFNSFRK